MEGYGLTEGTCASSVNPLPTETEDRRKVGSIGIPLPGNEMKIVDEDGKDLPPNTKGEIIVKGDNVMKEYYKNPEANAETLKDGWLYTGDIARKDSEGYFFLVDRAKDLIKYKGHSVYPREIEDVIYEHPAVKLCAVVGIPDEISGEIPKAFIVLKDDVTVSEEEIIQFVKDRVAAYKRVRQVEFRTELPMSPAMKILKRELRNEATK